MPYIKQEARNFMNPTIDLLSHQIENIGDLNYSISMLVRKYLGKDYNYADLNSCMGVLECAKEEFYRKVVAPYEDKKIEENGDLK